MNRLPARHWAASFATLLAALLAGCATPPPTTSGGVPIDTSRSAQNVTSSYTDFEARLSSLNTQEERLLDMLSKSTDVETLIALEQRLSDVRYEIESIERNLRNYDAQIRYSTIDLTIRDEGGTLVCQDGRGDHYPVCTVVRPQGGKMRIDIVNRGQVWTKVQILSN